MRMVADDETRSVYGYALHNLNKYAETGELIGYCFQGLFWLCLT